jgi:hypothetical protein
LRQAVGARHDFYTREEFGRKRGLRESNEQA